LGTAEDELVGRSRGDEDNAAGGGGFDIEIELKRELKLVLNLRMSEGRIGFENHDILQSGLFCL
jgi:hypothetical protein